MRKVLLSTLILGLLATPLAYAHEKRMVGETQFVVGFVNEPAFNGEMNAIDLRVSDKEGTPIEGLEQTLKAEVGYGEGSEVMEILFRKRYNQSGAYAAYFLPVQPGKYRFHIHGSIADKAVDETFTSGEGFHDVENSKYLAFPRMSFKKS